MASTSVLDIIAKETNGKSYKTFKYSFESMSVPTMDYDEHDRKFTWKKHGETVYHDMSISLKKYADKLPELSQPLFRYFLDGSRHTYKVDDISYAQKVFPVIAGQVGVGCCMRDNGIMKPAYSGNEPLFWRDLVISLPNTAFDSDWQTDFSALQTVINDKIKNINLNFSAIIPYSTDKVAIGDKMENRGIAKIQDFMITREKQMVAKLVGEHFLSPDGFLIKDGSLEYVMTNVELDELEKFKNNYQFVVGVSKSFNPEYCIDKDGNNNSNMIANLPVFHRTPVNKYYSERIGDVYFAVWFVRIRERKYSNSPFDGVLKIEKILKNETEIEKGLDSELVDRITANIINERNPVCYGADRRWANHLYPIYVTESYLKSKYLGTNMFLNLF